MSVLVAGSTSLIAYLLDPAIKKIFIEKDQTLLFIIPIIIIFAFATKGISLYLSKAIMIGVAEEVKTNVPKKEAEEAKKKLEAAGAKVELK